MSLDFRTFQSAGKTSTHIIPGAYSRVDSIKGAGGLASSNNGVILGKSTGGVPFGLLQFNTFSEAHAMLKGGELLEAVRLAFSPGGDYSPQRIFAMRVNAALQGSLNLADGSSNPMVTLKSRDYGGYTNQINVTVEAGTTLGKKITVGFQSENPEVHDDIYRGSFSILYSSACTMTIVNTATVQTLETSVGGLTTPIDLNSFATIGDLAGYINSLAGFTCTAVPGSENHSPIHLDGVTGTSIASTAYIAQSTMQAIIATINSSSQYLEAVAANDAITRAIPANLVQSYLSGGTDGAYTSSEWSTALTALESADIQFVSTPSTDSAVHASIKAHCVAMSGVTGRHERQFLVGGPWKTGVYATDASAAIAAAVALNSYLGMYVFNGGKQYNTAGIPTNFPASYVACMLMGMKCAMAINEPLTFKSLDLMELEWSLSDSKLENLLKNGVATVNYAPNSVPRLVRQFNTYQTNDLKYNEFSAVTEMFFVSRDLRIYLENLFVGSPATSVVGGVLRGAVAARLMGYEELGVFTKHPVENRSWWDVVINISGDAVYVDYNAYITLPVNFMFVTNHFHEMVATL